MKLYELDRNTKFKIKDLPFVYVLDHMDGMYSVCYHLQPDGEYSTTISHILAYAEVEKLDE